MAPGTGLDVTIISCNNRSRNKCVSLQHLKRPVLLLHCLPEYIRAYKHEDLQDILKIKHMAELEGSVGNMQSKSHYDWRSVSMSWCRAPLWGPRPDLLFPFFCRKIALLFVLGRLLWREDGSVICSAICHWSETLRTHNHTLLSHLRLLASLSVASYDSQGLRWKYSYPPPHGETCSQNEQIMCALACKCSVLETVFASNVECV
jgi:hypothetical protein